MVSRSAFKHISAIVLLLFIFTIGGKAVVAIRGCHCVEDIANEQHHSCRGVSATEGDCDYHSQAVEENCLSHCLDIDNLDAVTSDSKLTITQRFILLTYVITPTYMLSRPERVHCDDTRCFDALNYTLDWICDVGLLRAPPCC